MAVPKLRFPEFNGEWTERNLGDLGEFKNGVNKDKGDFGKGFPFVNLMDVFGKNSILKPHLDLVNVTKKELKENNLVKGDVLFIRSSVKPSGVGLTAVLTQNLENTVYSGFLIRFREIKKTFDLGYKKYCFYAPKFRRSLIRKSTTSANTNINQDSLKKLVIEVPSIHEQQKIASFLSKVDSKIDLLEKKQELWETYKKGVMQQIFSQKLRFKDENGEDYPDWKEKKFNQVFDFISTNSFSRADLNEESGEIYNIHYGDIHTKFQPIVDFNKVKVPYINQDVDLKRIKSESYCQNGDLIIADASEDYEDIGKAVELKNLNNRKVLAGLHTLLTRDKGKYTKEGYRNHMMLDNNVKLQIKKLATGVSVIGISKNNLGKINLNIPSIPEQTKIAGFLSSIDSKIEQIYSEFKINKEFKRGLLQKMFI